MATRTRRGWTGSVSAGAAALVAGLVAWTGAPQPAQAFGQPVRPITGPGGHVLRNALDQTESANWSGYVLAHYATGATYASATGTWVVPAVTVPPGYSTGYSASWVGIGGYCQNSACSSVDNTLIQLGTEQDASTSGTQYEAWWETLPGPAHVIKKFTVAPGDRIFASLTLNAATAARAGRVKPGARNGKSTGQSWTLTMTNLTTGAHWSTTVSYNSSLASAEWIEEAPYSGGILPLADFSTVTFDPGTADNANPALVPADAVVMLDPNGETSNPSVPDVDTDGFNACWGSGTTLTACPSNAS